MLPPIRCFTCGKVIAHLFPLFERREDTVGENTVAENTVRAFGELGLRRDCCKRMLLAHVNLADRLIAPLTVDDEASHSDDDD